MVRFHTAFGDMVSGIGSPQDPALRTLIHACVYLWKQARARDMNIQAYHDALDIFQDAWKEFSVQEKWEL